MQFFGSLRGIRKITRPVMKLVAASEHCHEEEGLDSFRVSSDSPGRVTAWQSFGLAPGRTLDDLSFLKMTRAVLGRC